MTYFNLPGFTYNIEKGEYEANPSQAPAHPGMTTGGIKPDRRGSTIAPRRGSIDPTSRITPRRGAAPGGGSASGTLQQAPYGADSRKREIGGGPIAEPIADSIAAAGGGYRMGEVFEDPGFSGGKGGEPAPLQPTPEATAINAGQDPFSRSGGKAPQTQRDTLTYGSGGGKGMR